MLHEEEMQQDVGAGCFVFFIIPGQLPFPVSVLRDEKAVRENVRNSKFSKCVRSDFCLRDRWCC